MNLGCGTIRMTARAALLIALLTATPAAAETIFEYQFTTSVPTVFDFSPQFYLSNPSEIHGRFGQGPDGSWAATTQPATVRFYVDNNQLTRLDIVNFDANLRTFPQPGDQIPDDFNHIRMNVSINLQSQSTAVSVPAGASFTGQLSAITTANVERAGTLVASSTLFGNQATFNVGMMSGALLGSFNGFGGAAQQFLPGLNGTVEPSFSTWLPIDGTYVSPVSGQEVNFHGLFDMNGYLTFMSAQAAPVPEPSTLVLLAFGVLGLLGFGWQRLNKV
jgi:PEP-CTERM motif